MMALNFYCLCYGKTKEWHNYIRFLGHATTVNFYLTEHCISTKQPFNGVTPSLQHNILDVKGGRHASKEVARCFRRWISDKQNTFCKDPQKLNFAIKGMLTVTYRDHTYSISDMVLAQGRSGFSNNWWLGGLRCQYKDINMPQGFDSIKDNITCLSNSGDKLCFHRGNTHSVNSIYVAIRPC